ncbi:MAG: phenylacetic acid degradation operon negative regulatory protein PaaX [Rhizobiales bacterium]|nr:phenylacetic acid degradation operon negative regulatory protein PaaX [Hyphomicrobiales bacterium]
MSDGSAAFAGLVAAHHARTPPRTGSLIVTIFGMVALPATAPIRLSDLQDWLAALEIEPGLVRTALSRLVADGTLLRERDGKAALYRLSDRAQRDFRQAADLIFGREIPRPTGFMHLALLEEGSPRTKLRAVLSEAGFVPLAPNLVVSPEHAGVPVSLPAGCLLLRSEANADLAARAPSLWPLTALQEGYRAVLEHARALEAESSTLGPGRGFLARILLVHEFRRIVLRDPFLPAELLPKNWPGAAARQALDRALAAIARQNMR